MVRYAETLNEAYRLEKRSARIKWEDFVHLLKNGGYPIKLENDNSLLLGIYGEPYADIEVSYSGDTGQDFVGIYLWHYQFVDPDLEVKYVREPTTLYGNLVDAIGYINELYRAIRAERGQS